MPQTYEAATKLQLLVNQLAENWSLGLAFPSVPPVRLLDWVSHALSERKVLIPFSSV